MMEVTAKAEIQDGSVRTMDLSVFVDGILLGNEHALEALYEATVGKVYALAFAVLRNAEDAEDIVCMTYAYVWTDASRYDAGRGPVLGWLLMLCRSRALDRLRQRRTIRPVGAAEDLQNVAAEDARPDDILCLMQRHSAVRAALGKLAPARRHLVSLAFLQGMSHQEIAAATGLALGTVKSHLRRALAQLRKELEVA